MAIGDAHPYQPNLTLGPTVAEVDSVQAAGIVHAQQVRGPTYVEIMQAGWSAQAAWEIDPVNGRDSNTGAPGAPLQTWAELRARQRGGRQLSSTITILSPLPAGDPLVFDWDIGGRGELVDVVAVPATVASVVLTGATTQLVPATSTWPKLFAAAHVWTPWLAVNGLAYAEVTAAVAGTLGSWAWVIAEPAPAGTCLTSMWTDANVPCLAPDAGDTLTLYTPQPLAGGYTITPKGTGQLRFFSFDLSSGYYEIAVPGTVLVQFLKCITSQIEATGATWFNCSNVTGNDINLQGGQSSPTVLTAGYYTHTVGSTAMVQYGASLLVDAYAYIELHSLIVQHGGYFEGAEFGMFQAGSDAITVRWGGGCDLRSFCGDVPGGVAVFAGSGGIAALHAATMYIPGDCNAEGSPALTWAALIAASGYQAGTNAAAWITKV